MLVEEIHHRNQRGWQSCQYVLHVLIMVFFSSPAHSISLFVSADGNNLNNGLTPGNALFNIQLAIDRAKPGDVVIILNGAYYQDIKSTRHGEPDKPITIRGQGMVSIHGAGAHRVVELRHSYIWLINLDINGLYHQEDSREAYRDKLVYIKGSPESHIIGILLKQLRLKNAAGECLRMKFVNHSEVSDNHIQTCGLEDFGQDKLIKKNGEGIYLGTAPEQLESPLKDLSSFNLIASNTINTQGAECIDIKEYAENNFIINNICTGQKDPDSAGISTRGSRNIIHGNIVFNNVGAGIRTGGDTNTNGIQNTITGNLLENNQNSGLKLMSGPQERVCGNKIVQENGRPKVRSKPGLEHIILEDCKP